MPFTVGYADKFNNRQQFEAYVRLLERNGIDWSNTPRVPEPGTSNRWLYVWSSRDDAERFCNELRAETRDHKWVVRELAEGMQPSPGPLARVVILMRPSSLGAEFSLHPQSQSLIRRRFPHARPVSSIAIEWITRSDFEQQHGPIWEHIAVVLTGLTLEELDTLDGYQVYDLMREKPVYDSQLTATA